MGSSSSTPRKANILQPPPNYVPETYSPTPPPAPAPPPATDMGTPTSPLHHTAAFPGGGEAERVVPGFPPEREGFDDSAAAGLSRPPLGYGHEGHVEEMQEEQGGREEEGKQEEGEGESMKRLHAAVDSVGAAEGPLRKRRAREAEEAGIASEEGIFADLTTVTHDGANGGANDGENSAADEVSAGSTGADISAGVDAVGVTVEHGPAATDGGGTPAATASVATTAITFSSDAPSSFAPSLDIASTTGVAPPALDPSSYHASFGAADFTTSAVTAATMGTVTVTSAGLCVATVAAAGATAASATPPAPHIEVSEAMYGTITSRPDISGLPSSTADLDVASPPSDVPATGVSPHAPVASPSIISGIADADAAAAPPPSPLSVSAGEGISSHLGDGGNAPSPGCPDELPQQPQLAPPTHMPFSLSMPMSVSMLMPSTPLPPGSIKDAPQCEAAAPTGVVAPAPYHNFLSVMPPHQIFHPGPVPPSTAGLPHVVAGGAPLAGTAGSFGSTYADAAAMPAMPVMPAMSAAASFIIPQTDSLALGATESALATQPMVSAFLAGVGVGAGNGSGGDTPIGVPSGPPPAVAGGVSKARPRRKKATAAVGGEQSQRKNRNRPACATEGCTLRPLFGVDGTRQANFCARHKEPHMVNVLCRRCEVEECGRQPSFGAAGARPTRCAAHKLEGMRNVSAPRCQHDECQVCPSFGKHGDKRARFCAAHRREGDVDLVTRRCHHEGCVRRPVFGHAPERKVYYCARHKLDGMVNVFAAHCEFPGCSHQPSWGLPGVKRPTHCAKHRTQAHENKRKT